MSVKKLAPGVPSGPALPGWTSWKGILRGQGGGSCRWIGGRDIFRGGWKAGILAHPQLAGASLQCGAVGGGAQLGEPRGLVGGGDQGGTDPSLCLSQGQRDIPVPRSWGRRKEEGSFLRSRDSPIDTREGAPSNSIQPPPHTGTPALPYLGEPRTHVGSSGGRGLSRLSLECKVRRGAS